MIQEPNIRELTQIRYISEYNRVKKLFDGIRLEQLTTPLLQKRLMNMGKQSHLIRSINFGTFSSFHFVIHKLTDC